MRLRALPLLLVLVLLAVPAAMLVYVATLDEADREEKPGATGPAVTAGGTGPAGAVEPVRRPVPRPSRPSVRPPSVPRAVPSAAPRSLASYPAAPPVDPRFAARLSGRVVDPDGKPLAGVAVRVLRIRRRVDPTAFFTGTSSATLLGRAGEARTDARGRFSLGGLEPEAAHALVVRHGSFCLWIREFEEIAFPEPVRLGDIRLRRGVVVTGRCRDPEGRPVAGAVVTSLPPGNAPLGGWTRAALPGLAPAATTGGDGAFRLEGVLPGTIRLRATAAGRVAADHVRPDTIRGETVSGVKLVLAPGLPIGGEVVGPDERGLAGVQVFVQRLEVGGKLARAPAGVTTSDAEGRFTFAGVPVGPCQVSAWRPGRKPVQIRSVAGRTDLRLQFPAPRRFTIHGTVVVRGTGEPIAGARIGFAASPFGAEPAAPAAVVSGADGTFRFEADERWMPSVVEARADGYAVGRSAPLTLQSDSGPPPELRIHLNPAARLSGRVVRSGGGQGVEGAVVHLYRVPGENQDVFEAVISMGGGLRSAEARAACDASGAFSIDGVAPGHYVVEARAAGYAPARRDKLHLTAGAETRDVVLALGAGGSIHGTVRFTDGAPAVGLLVSVSDEDARTYDARVQASGDFRIDHLVPGEYRVTVGTAGGSVWDRVQALAGRVRIAEGGVVQRALTVQRGVRMHGVVRAFGAPRARCRVSVKAGPDPERDLRPGAPLVFHRARETKTDAEGRYELTDVPPGPVEIRVRVPGAKLGASSVEALVKEVQVPRQVDWRFDLELPTGAVRGRVVRPSGVAADADRPRLELTAVGRRPGVRRTLFAAADGTFAFDFLPPGDYVVHVFATAFWTAVDRRVTVGAGVATVGVEIVLRRGVAVRGRVENEAGQPVGRAQVRVLPFAEDAGRGKVEVRTRSNGTFEIPALVPGRYTFFAESGGLRSASREVRVPPAGLENLRLVVRPARR